jgi:hypothetical protein
MLLAITRIVADAIPADAAHPDFAGELVQDLRLRPGQARELLAYLRDHDDAFVSGRSDGPQARLRLLHMLAERFPDQVKPAQCVRCGRTGLLNRRLDGQRCCGRCYSASFLRPCIRCGNTGRPQIRENGGVVCIKCIRRDRSRWEPCGGCGKTYRVVRRLDDGTGLCQTCSPRRLYTCTACGRPERPAHAILETGPICGACYHRRKVAECSSCHTVSPYVRRRPGIEAMLCQACWTPPPVACAFCGQLKPIKRGRVSGTPVCEGCRAQARPRRRCADCGKFQRIHSKLDKGDVCGPCYTKIRNRPGSCPVCLQVRPLICQDTSSVAICGPCGGDQRDWICRDCGRFAALFSNGRCPTCVATERVHALLSGPDGQVRAQLSPLVDLLDIETDPRSVILWLYDAAWAELLGQLATEHQEITHAILDALPQRKHVDYLRQVLVNIGALPERDEDIDGTTLWLEDLLGTQPTEVAQIVRPYATWSVLRRARNRAERSSPTGSVRKYARSRILLAMKFLSWLDRRGSSLATVGQADIDAWLDDGSVNHYRLRDFLLWARACRLVGDISIPWLARSDPEEILTPEDRWQMLRRCLHDEQIPTCLRVAGALILLYAQNPSRIVRLTREDLATRGNYQYLTLGQHPVILPPKLATLLKEQATAAVRWRRPRVELDTPHRHWLFPGNHPGQHATADRISTLLARELGLYTRPARAAALCALAEDLPAAVLADLLGVHVTTAIRWASLIRHDWFSYLNARADRVDAEVAGSRNTALSQ